jgi:hypothetical protein
MAGLGEISGVRFRTPAGIGRGLQGWFAHAMARHVRHAGRHRRAPPEAVPACRRRDPLLPLTGISGNGQGARQPETQPSGHRPGCGVTRPVPLHLEIPFARCPKQPILHLPGLNPG